MAKKPTMQKSRRASKSRLIFGSKITDDEAMRLIINFATFYPGQFIASHMNLSRPTVYSIYAAIRHRMIEIGYYQSPEWWIENIFLDPDDRELLRLFVEAGLRLRRNVRRSERYLHEAELASKFAYAHFYKDAPSETALMALWAQDMYELILMTGPLRKPARNIDKAKLHIWKAVGRRMPRDEYRYSTRQEIRRLKAYSSGRRKNPTSG